MTYNWLKSIPQIKRREFADSLLLDVSNLIVFLNLNENEKAMEASESIRKTLMVLRGDLPEHTFFFAET
jgi:hypothetical protein